MRTMYDAVTPGNIPGDAQMVAGYVEGIYTWKKADWDRFPRAIKVSIAIWAADADVLDIEQGDATPDMGPAWCRRQIKRGIRPTLYCNLSTWPAVQGYVNQAGLQGQVDYWIAHYTQKPHSFVGAAACQYADPGPVDLSICDDTWPRHLAPAPKPVRRRRSDMLVLARDPKAPPDQNGVGAVYLMPFKIHLRTNEEVAFWLSLSDNPLDDKGNRTLVYAPGYYLDRIQEAADIPPNVSEHAYDLSRMSDKLDSIDKKQDSIDKRLGEMATAQTPKP